MSEDRRPCLHCMLGQSLGNVQHCGCETPDGYCKLFPKPLTVGNERKVEK